MTIIADNYFGYCKKEVKTQLSFACNLFGSEEEHAGGALAFANISWGSTFSQDHRVMRPNHHYEARYLVAPYSMLHNGAAESEIGFPGWKPDFRPGGTSA